MSCCPVVLGSKRPRTFKPALHSAVLWISSYQARRSQDAGTFWREKQLPQMVQAWGERRSQEVASCARCASSTSRFRCHSTVLYTSMPCAPRATTVPDVA